jgi:hypothetical protein
VCIEVLTLDENLPLEREDVLVGLIVLIYAILCFPETMTVLNLDVGVMAIDEIIQTNGKIACILYVYSVRYQLMPGVPPGVTKQQVEWYQKREVLPGQNIHTVSRSVCAHSCS